MEGLKTTSWKEKVDVKLHQLSIKELIALVVKLVSVAFFSMLVIYAVGNRVTMHYQELFTRQILLITVLERDIEENLVNYALLQGAIMQGGEEAVQRDFITTLTSKTNNNLLLLHQLVKEDEKLLSVKGELDRHHADLAQNILMLQSLKLGNQRSTAALNSFKKETLSSFEELIILREALSGKIALIDARNMHSNITKNNALVRANLSLGIKMAELANSVSVLIYVDNIDQLININSNQLTQNLKQVENAIKQVAKLTKPLSSLHALYQLTNEMSLKLKGVNSRLLGDGLLTKLIKKRFASNLALANASKSFQLGLDVIENDLTLMAVMTKVVVAKAVNEIEKISRLSILVLVVISFVFVLLLGWLLAVIARQINNPTELLNTTMERLTHGDLTARLPVGESVPAEFSSIWEDFNAFAQSNEEVITEQELIFDNADVGIGWLRDRKYLRANQKLLSIFGYSEEDFLGKNSRFIYKSEELYREVGKNGYAALAKGEVYVIELELLRADGTIFWCKMSGKGTGSDDESSSIWLHEDITERKLANEKLYQLANYDSLTSLPNRDLFNIYLDEAILKAKRNSTEFAVLFVDLDRFKHINDSMGHDAGDMVLKEVATRMRSVLRESDILARLGGDEFTIIIDGIESSLGIEKVAKNILDELSRVMTYKEKEVFTGGSIGVSRYPQDGATRGDLLSSADSAMYEAKKSGRNRYSFYASHLGDTGERFARLSQALKKAVEHNEFELHYQPKINMQTREIVGAEALIRWNKPGEGLISPFEFIPVLEESGLMVQVGEWVIFETCRAISTLVALGYSPGKIAINLSERQFGSMQILDSIERALNETGISASNIELEITESLMMDDSDLTMDILNGIKKLGIDIAMDDFGTGYSSLAYLKRFPIDILKIDRAFVKDITEDADDAAIVDAIIAMAKRLKLTTVAEGIETEEQYAFLKERGCEIGQGYLFSKPIPFGEILELYWRGSRLEILGVDIG